MSEVRISRPGYRPYEGMRVGRRRAITSTIIHTLRYLLGLRRRARSKILPWGIAALSYLPALGFVAVTVFVPAAFADLAQEVLPGPEAYLGGIMLLVFLATALAGPAALCGDRRTGVLALYLASPLDRDTYLVAKAVAVTTFLTMVTVVPPLIYVLGTVLAGAGPGSASAVALAASRAVITGLALALLFGALSLAAASLTDRQTAAMGTVILFLLLSGAVVAGAVMQLDAPVALHLIDVTSVASGLVAVIYGERPPGNVSAVAIVAVWVAWTVALLVLTRWRYRRLAVTR